MRKRGFMYEEISNVELLFKTEEGASACNERQVIACGLDGAQLKIVRTSKGPITQCCFDKETYTVVTLLDETATKKLADYYHAYSVEDLPKILAAVFDDVDADVSIRDLCNQLQVVVHTSEQ